MKSLMLLLFFFLYSCTRNSSIEVDAIKVIKVDQHPTLADHSRRLIVVDDNGSPIDEFALYPDSGGGCNAYLFEVDDKYILIDCNGQWIGIDKNNGSISSEGWKWNQRLPTNPVGMFTSTKHRKQYDLKFDVPFSTSDVYRYKDPSEL